MSHPFQKFTVQYGAGDTVFNEGDIGSSMYIVQAGKVQLYREIDGQKQNLGILEKGDFFGEMSILEGLPRTQAAEVVEDTELIEINTTIFDKMIRGNIEIAVRMLRKLSIRLRESERRLSELQVSGAKPMKRISAPRRASAPRAAVDGGQRLESTDDGKSFGLSSRDTLVGRYDPVTEMKPDIDLTDLDLKRTVSRRHAMVLRSGEGFKLQEEVGALNGTFVNGTKLVTGQAYPLNDGDELLFGTVALVFRS